MSVKRIALWGATGSIGTQTLDVMGQHRDRFQLVVATAHSQAEALFNTAKTWRPRLAVLTGNVDRDRWARAFAAIDVKLLFGREGLLEAASFAEADLVVNALVGAVGLEATLKALQADVSMALANKEVLVMAGELVMHTVRQRKLSMLPVDSEHSALFQCLVGERPEDVDHLILTASGGPFRDTAAEVLETVTPAQALKHPNWSMGQKVTIDSATLVNKGLEVIEARWLFDLPPERIRVVVHPQSIIHSMVSFIDGSVKAQLGAPDMRLPIAYALGYPQRLGGNFRRMDWTEALTLNFEAPDLNRFPALGLAFEALKAGGTAPAVFSAADEIAVAAFVSGRIGFMAMPRLIEEALNVLTESGTPDLAAILSADARTRDFVSGLLPD